MEIIRVIVLGIVQGATEFLPISSSGHLVVVPWLLGWPASTLLFDTVLHWGTLLAILLVFWRDFVNILTASIRSIFQRSLTDPDARLGWLIVIGSIPAAALGLLAEEYVEQLFDSPRAAGFFLIITAGLLSLSEVLAKRVRNWRTLENLSLRQVIIIGSAQALALAPGISRSGSTIAAGLATGLRRDTAARFSFLLGAPVFFGAGLLQLTDAAAADSAELIASLPLLALGFVTSAGVGYIAIRFLLSYLRNHTLYVFAIYCAIIGLGTIGLTFIRG